MWSFFFSKKLQKLTEKMQKKIRNEKFIWDKNQTTNKLKSEFQNETKNNKNLKWKNTKNAKEFFTKAKNIFARKIKFGKNREN